MAREYIDSRYKIDTPKIWMHHPKEIQKNQGQYLTDPVINMTLNI